MYTASKGMQREREDLTGRLINPKLCNDNNTTIHFSHVSGVLIFKYRFTLIKQLAKFPFLYTHNLSSHMTTKKQKNYRIMFKKFPFLAQKIPFIVLPAVATLHAYVATKKTNVKVELNIYIFSYFVVDHTSKVHSASANRFCFINSCQMFN